MIRWFGLMVGGLVSGPAWADSISAPGATYGTAETLAPGEWEVGLYAPLRRGFENGLELSVHPITALLSPHLVAKKRWSEMGDWTLASQHGIHVPTSLLRTLARPGIGGILPADSDVPLIVALDTRFLATRAFGEDTQVTFSARLMAGLELSDGNWPTIDAPIAYTRTAAYQDTLSAAMGAQVDGVIQNRLAYRIDLDGWVLPMSEGKWAAEGRGVLIWRHSEGFSAQLSGTAVVGAYPYGNSWHLLPGFDLIWGF